jgi:sugar/nucleoside kinase (ribokinase family)
VAAAKNSLASGGVFFVHSSHILRPFPMKNPSPNTRRGLLAGGNWIIDQVKMIDVYPQPEQLSNIRSQSQGTGGAPYNVLIDLAKSGAPFPLLAAGLVGEDSLGEQILEDCRQHHIDVRYLGTPGKPPPLTPMS